MRFTVWNLPFCTRKDAGICSRTHFGSSSITVLLVCMTFCLASSVDASCKALVASNSQGSRSAQQLRQYIDCMRLVENSYFKRSGGVTYQSDLENDVNDVNANDVSARAGFGNTFTKIDAPFTLGGDPNSARYQNQLSRDDGMRGEDEQLYGLILLKESESVLRSLLEQRNLRKKRFANQLVPRTEDTKGSQGRR